MMGLLFKFVIMVVILVLPISNAGTLPESKIVGGVGITIAQAPYQISLRLRTRESVQYGRGHICGGTVISQRLIATAAHCIYNEDTSKYRKNTEFVVVLGSTYLTTTQASTLEYRVQQLIPQDNYVHSTLTNDIALLFINGYVPWTATNVAALPLNSNQVSAGLACTVSGWGLTKEGGSSVPNQLQMATTPLVSYTDCEKGYASIPLSALCAGYLTGGIDACQGDSGGPLHCDNKLVGIVSSGYGCARPNYPGVYTNVSYFHDWIVKVNNTLDYSHFSNNIGSVVNKISLSLAIIMITTYVILS